MCGPAARLTCVGSEPSSTSCQRVLRLRYPCRVTHKGSQRSTGEGTEGPQMELHRLSFHRTPCPDQPTSSAPRERERGGAWAGFTHIHIYTHTAVLHTNTCKFVQCCTVSFQGGLGCVSTVTLPVRKGEQKLPPSVVSFLYKPRVNVESQLPASCPENLLSRPSSSINESH